MMLNHKVLMLNRVTAGTFKLAEYMREQNSSHIFRGIVNNIIITLTNSIVTLLHNYQLLHFTCPKGLTMDIILGA